MIYTYKVMLYYYLMCSKNFRNTCLKVYELDPAHFLALPGLAWQACLKKTSIELELLTDYDMLLMVGRRNKRWNMPFNT